MSWLPATHAGSAPTARWAASWASTVRRSAAADQGVRRMSNANAWPSSSGRANAAVRSGGPQASATAGDVARDRPPRPVDLVHLGPVPVRVHGSPTDLVVGRVLGQPARDVHPEPVDPAREPEPQGLREVLLHRRVRPVQVGLLGCEQVQVEGTVGQARPRGAAEHRPPAVRRRPHVEQRALRDRRRARRRTTGAGRTRGWAPGP